MGMRTSTVTVSRGSVGKCERASENDSEIATRSGNQVRLFVRYDGRIRLGVGGVGSRTGEAINRYRPIAGHEAFERSRKGLPVWGARGGLR